MVLKCYSVQNELQVSVMTFQNHNLPQEQHSIGYWTFKNHKHDQKVGNELQVPFLIMKMNTNLPEVHQQ